MELVAVVALIGVLMSVSIGRLAGTGGFDEDCCQRWHSLDSSRCSADVIRTTKRSTEDVCEWLERHSVLPGKWRNRLDENISQVTTLQ